MDNKRKVQDELKAKHEKVILGKHIDHVEYLKLIVALMSGPAAVAAYLQSLAASILTETGQNVAIETVYDLLRGKSDDTIIGDKPVYVGIVTYKHWSEEFFFGEWRKPEPNTHQLYIAIGRKRKATEETVAFYVIQNKVLHRVDPDSGDYEKLANDWSGSTSMTGLNGKLYIIQNDVLHRVDPATGDYEKLKHQWDGPTQMAAMNGRLYIVQNSVLHNVDPDSGEYNRLKNDWEGTTAMAGFDGKLIIIQNAVLHRVNPITGDYNKLKHVWDGPAHAFALSLRW